MSRIALADLLGAGAAGVATDGDIGPGMGQGQRHGPADAARTSGDKRLLAQQAEIRHRLDSARPPIPGVSLRVDISLDSEGKQRDGSDRSYSTQLLGIDGLEPVLDGLQPIRIVCSVLCSRSNRPVMSAARGSRTGGRCLG